MRKKFFDERGFTTAGVVVALLLTLSLIFTSAQVYEVNSTAATIQNVADAAVLAAENQVAEFYVVARVCDAVVLSLSLTGVAAIALGIVAACIPATLAISERLIQAGTDVMRARNSFAEKAASGLNSLQKALPFISAANAEAVMRSNSLDSRGPNYNGLALLLPFEGKEIQVGIQGATERLAEQAGEKKQAIQEAAQKAEEAAERAREIKHRAFMHDCGADPEYCMRERAAHLSGIAPGDNPSYHSVETWDFSVALRRAQAYYPRRLAEEAPQGSSSKSRADSALRKRFYAYAVEQMSAGYVREDAYGGFEAHFPLLPKNTSEMRATSLYDESVYPITIDDEGVRHMHAWAGCPRHLAETSHGVGSMRDLDAGEFETCTACEFSVSGFGKIAAATSSVETGFEYHYRIVAESAREYQKAREDYTPFAEEVKSLTEGVFETAKEAFGEAIGYRIKVEPPGSYGAIALVVNTQEVDTSRNFASRFVQGSNVLGAQVALSAATLVGDKAEEGTTVLSSLLDGIVQDSQSVGLSLADGVLDLWSTLLHSYTQGHDALTKGVEEMLSSIPLVSESGLGTWASNALSDLVSTLGFEPVELDAPKPVLVNSGHVLDADDSGFSQGLLEVKQRYLSLEGAGSGSILGTAITQIEAAALEGIDGFDGELVLASIDLLGEEGPSIPLTIVLPPAVKSAAKDLVSQAAQMIADLEASVTGVRQWE